MRHILSACIAASCVTVLSVCASNTENNNVSVEQKQNSGVLIPAIPDKVEWCGEVLNINNEYYRERIDRELLNFTYSHSSTIQILKRANRYFPIFERIMREEGVPEDLKYLAIVESNLNIRGYSTAKAAGLWQMIPDAARDLKLQVDDNVDERYHVEKSTRAACKYLRRAHDLLGTWNLAAAAYNAGIGRVTKLKKQQEADNFYEMNMTEETNRYVFRLLAIKEFMKDPKKYGFDLKESDLYHAQPCDTIGIDSSIANLAQFSKQRGLNYNLLKEENLWLRSNTLPNPDGKHYVLRMPIINGSKKQ